LLIKELSGKYASFVAPEYSLFQCFEGGDVVSPPEKKEKMNLNQANVPSLPTGAGDRARPSRAVLGNLAETGSDFALPPESMKYVQYVVKIFAPSLLCVFALKPFAQSCPDVAPMWPHRFAT